jgi:hypothetical protein
MAIIVEPGGGPARHNAPRLIGFGLEAGLKQRLIKIP